MTLTIIKRLVASFVAAAIPNVLVGTLVDVALWQSAVMSGAIAVLTIVQALAVGYKDGKLTAEEIEQAFKR
jgi:hypothetical protein